LSFTNEMFAIVDKFMHFVYNIKQIEVKDLNRKKVIIMPETQKRLSQMGEQIKLARLRRNLSSELVAERAGISRTTLWNVEKGEPSVAIGAYAAVLHAINGMDRDLILVAKDEDLSKKMHELNIEVKKHSSHKHK